MIAVSLFGLRQSWRPGITIVCEKHVRANKRAILQGEPFPHHVPVLDGHVVPNGNPGFNEAMVSDIAVRAYGDILHYMGEGPYASALTDELRLYYRSWMYEYTVYDHLLQLQPISDSLGKEAIGSPKR